MTTNNPGSDPAQRPRENAEANSQQNPAGAHPGAPQGASGQQHTTSGQHSTGGQQTSGGQQSGPGQHSGLGGSTHSAGTQPGIGGTSAGQSSAGAQPRAQSPGQPSGGQASSGQQPGGQASSGQQPGGQASSGQQPGGHASSGQQPGGQQSGGQASGQQPGGSGGGNANGGQASREGGSTSGLTAKSHETAEQLKHAAMGQVDQFRERADSAKGQAVERIRRLGSALRTAGDGLREQDQFIAGYADEVSRRIEQVAEYLGSADPRTLVRDTEQFARRKPAVFFGGAFLLGLAAGRFVKSSRASETELNSDILEPATEPGYRRVPPLPPSERRTAQNERGR